MARNLVDFVSRGDAEAFEAALNGATPATPELARLLETAHQAGGVSLPGPDPAFVAALGTRLQAQAAAVPAGPDAGAPTAAPANVVTIHRTWPKVLAGAAAGVIVAGTGLGVASQGALPGDALYGVRSVVDGLEVRFAGSDGEQGRTLLSQAREHVDDTEVLADRSEQDLEAIRTSLKDAAASVDSGNTKLFSAFDADRQPGHLAVVQEFTAWAQPRLQALRSRIPAAAAGDLGSLQATVDAGATTLRAKLASCGDACAGIIAPANPATTTVPAPSATTAATSPSPAGTTPGVPASSDPASVPAPPVPATTRVPSPRLTTPPPPIFTPRTPRPVPTTQRTVPPRTTAPRPTVPRPPVPTSVTPTRSPEPTDPGPQPTSPSTSPTTTCWPPGHCKTTSASPPETPDVPAASDTARGVVPVPGQTAPPEQTPPPEQKPPPEQTPPAPPPATSTIPTTASPGLPGPTTTVPEPPTSSPPAPGIPTTSPEPTSTLVPVIPAAPRFADHCVEGNGIVHLPRVPGVSYSWYRTDLLGITTVTVDAEADPGYRIAEGATAHWAQRYLGCKGS